MFEKDEDCHGINFINVEAKPDILSYLNGALVRTRDGYDARLHMKYDPDLEAVRVITRHGEQLINVACDSGLAMIKDVVNHIKL